MRERVAALVEEGGTLEFGVAHDLVEEYNSLVLRAEATFGDRVFDYGARKALPFDGRPEMLVQSVAHFAKVLEKAVE